MSTFKIIPPKFYPEDLRISGILKTKPQILRFRFEDLGYSDVTSTFEDLKMPCDHETFIWGALDHHETFCFVDFGSNDYFSY